MSATEAYADTIHDRCRRNGLLVSTEGPTVMVLPSLGIDKQTAARGLDILARSI
jgi:4-aminobutyrate aminotransferase-like enzyme